MRQRAQITPIEVPPPAILITGDALQHIPPDRLQELSDEIAGLTKFALGNSAVTAEVVTDLTPNPASDANFWQSIAWGFKSLRQAARMSQKRLAEQLDTTQSHISEREVRTTSIPFLRRYVDVLGFVPKIVLIRKRNENEAGIQINGPE